MRSSLHDQCVRQNFGFPEAEIIARMTAEGNAVHPDGGHFVGVNSVRMVPADGSISPGACRREAVLHAAQAGEGPCKLTVNHYRRRKTGPRLLVVSCGHHGVSFTVYAMGFAPYRRGEIAPIRADGASLAPPSWSATIFGPVLEAAEGEL